MPLSRRQRQGSIDIWPGFVDALTQLTMVIVFLLLIFTAGQFYLTGAVSSKDAALKKLTAELNQLSDVLALEKQTDETLQLRNADLSHKLAGATATVAAGDKTIAQQSAELQTLQGNIAASQQARTQLEAQLSAAQAQAAATQKQLDTTSSHLSQDEATLAALNQNLDQLRKQLVALADALDIPHADQQDNATLIKNLGAKLDLALARKVAELAAYRSEFFGRLNAIIGNRPGIRIVGDRFVFQSEILFPQASAQLGPDGEKRLAPVVAALREIAKKIPPSIHWILEIDGHTDIRPIDTPQFHSNWELSTARAASVVKFLIAQGIPPTHLAAAGYGEFQPLDPGTGEAAWARNRRIEIKLTQR